MSSTKPYHFVSSACHTIKDDVIHRSRQIFRYAGLATMPILLSLLPVASAQNDTDPVENLSNNAFEPHPANDSYTQGDIAAESGAFPLDAWAHRGALVRSNGNNLWCTGNLSLALRGLGILNTVEYQGASGALSLLPTAGALIGTPTRELWSLYKLMPAAGILTMFLSLGGTIIPTQAGEYDQKYPLSYDGMMPTNTSEDKKALQELLVQVGPNRPPSEMFAARVEKRASSQEGSLSYTRLYVGVFVQAFLISVILIALWYGQLGGVIVWWCTVWGWMYFWYFLVAVTSVIENIANTPFTESWTLRISKAPRTVRVDGPKVNRNGDDIISVLASGFNVKSTITIDRSEPYSVSQACFYAVIQKTGITAGHAALRVFSKAASVAVFAFGTVLFASAQLMSVTITLMVLSLVLGAGVLGRITAMFILSEMNRHNIPIMHAVVQERNEAADHLQKILDIPGLVIEIGGIVIVDGKCILQRNEWFTWGRYFGLLAAPFDVAKRAIKVDGHGTTSEQRRPIDDIESGRSNNDLEPGQHITLLPK